MLSSRAADMPSKIGMSPTALLWSHVRGRRRHNKSKGGVSVDETEFRQAYIWSTGRWSPSAFANGYQGGFIKHSLMDPTEREELNTHNVKGPSTHILVLLRNLRAIFGTEITESSQAILPA